jgi:hypothetical protein
VHSYLLTDAAQLMAPGRCSSCPASLARRASQPNGFLAIVGPPCHTQQVQWRPATPASHSCCRRCCRRCRPLSSTVQAAAAVLLHPALPCTSDDFRAGHRDLLREGTLLGKAGLLRCGVFCDGQGGLPKDHLAAQVLEVGLHRQRQAKVVGEEVLGGDLRWWVGECHSVGSMAGAGVCSSARGCWVSPQVVQPRGHTQQVLLRAGGLALVKFRVTLKP